MSIPAEGRARDVIVDVRSACEKSGRPTTEAEVLRALDGLSADEAAALRRLARSPLPVRHLSPDALVDILRGVDPQVAAARELGGYYAMKAERDALATIAARSKPVADEEEESSAEHDSDDDQDAGSDDETYEDSSDDDSAEEDSDDDSDDESYDEDSDEESYDYDLPDEEDDEEAAERALADARAASRGSTRASDEEEEDETPAPAPARRPAPVARPTMRADEEDAAEEDEYEPPDLEEAPKKAVRRKPNPLANTPEGKEQERVLVTLFAYHRDAVLVAQSLGIGLAELNDRIEALNLRRKLNRMLEMTTDIDVFSPVSVPRERPAEAPVPVVRKRGEKPERTSTPDLPAPTPFERSVPAARTTAVNAHGTRVYRRSPESAPAPAPAATPDNLGPRREYVRESRRKSRAVAPAAPRREPVAPAEPPKPQRQPFAELQASGGKAILNKLLADEKANPRVLAVKLAERFGGPAGREISEGDLRQLVQHHGLAALFAERELANVRFLIGFHQGARAKLTNALQLTPSELDPYLTKLRLADDLERTRTERARVELGRRKLHDRVIQVLTRAPYLDDLGILPVIDREVRDWLTDAFASRAGKGTAAEVSEAVRAETGVEPNAFAKLLRRYELTPPA